MTPEIAHWQDHAACAGLNPRWWFPEAGESVKDALAVCNTCEVKAACLDYALTNGEKFGIYGGTTARQRQKMRGPQHRKTRQASHGTPSGYNWHLTHHEPPCWACADANSRHLETVIQLRRDAKR